MFCAMRWPSTRSISAESTSAPPAARCTPRLTGATIGRRLCTTCQQCFQWKCRRWRRRRFESTTSFSVERVMQKIKPCLWFDNNAEEAMNFYLSIFKDGKVVSVHHADGKVLVVDFVIKDQEIMGLNGGPMFKPSEAASLFVSC